ncbi:MAG: hypothetical protein KDK70_07960, partial [Myxococcales bacterium]|nr:hypothetical protein [Myxococcales bacterium]
MRWRLVALAGLLAATRCGRGEPRDRGPATGSGEPVAQPTAAPSGLPEPPPLDEALLRRHTVALADDAMQGRGPGTEGGARAVAYIVAQLEALGVEPAGEGGGWTQTVPMRTVRLDPARSSFALHQGPGEPQPLALGAQLVATSPGPAGSTQLDAPLVFVGHGITAPEYGWDDYGDADLRGAIAVARVGDPPLDDRDDRDDRFEGPALSAYGRWSYKFERAQQAGALGCLVVHETKAASYDWEVVRSSFSGARTFLREPPRPRLALQGWIHGDVARRLAAASEGGWPGW